MMFAEGGRALTPGAMLAGRYRVERLLDDDAYGRRYVAEDMQEGRRTLVLVREMFAAGSWESADRERAATWFRREVARLQELGHPAISSVRESWIAPGPAGSFYLVTEYTTGLTLAEELEESDGRVSWRRVVDWGIALCDILAFLHGRTPAYVHGALRPRYIGLDLVTDTPVLIEFGLTRRLADAAGDNWGYVPFEQYVGRVEPRSDLYALGAVLGTLVSGRDPDREYGHLRREGLDVQRTLRALFAPLDPARTGIPAELSKVLARATAFSVEDRHADALTMAAALRAVRGPAVEVEVSTADDAADEPVWTRLGFTRKAWFALPAVERNRRLLGLVKPPPPPA